MKEAIKTAKLANAPVAYEIIANEIVKGMQLKILVLSPAARAGRCEPKNNPLTVVVQKRGPNWAVTQITDQDGWPTTISGLTENFCLQVAAHNTWPGGAVIVP